MRPSLVSNCDLALLGHACRLPGAADPEAFWRILNEGRSTVSDGPEGRWQVERFLHPRRTEPGFSYTFAGGYIDNPFDFDAAAFGISPREAQQIDPQQRLLLEVVWEALEDAGLPPSSLAGEAVGVYVGASTVDYQTNVATDPAAIESHFMTGNSLSIVSNRISYIYDWRGPSFTVDSACSSSFVALGQAMAAIEAGVIDTAVVAGVNLLLSPAPFIGFSRASMLSPTGRSRPFSADGDGYVRSEGAVAVVLRRLASARQAGNRVRAVVAAAGSNSDGRTSGIALPSMEGQRRLLEATYGKLHLNPDQLAFVEAHGTGTLVGDPVEARAIGEALGTRRDAVLPVGSVKSNIGHLECVSGLAGLMKASLSLERRVYPKTLYLDRVNPHIPFGELNLRPVGEHLPLDDARPYAGVCNYGFGGTNAHVVLRRATPEEATGWQAAAVEPDRARLLLLSARTGDALSALAGAYADRIETRPHELSAVAVATAHDRDVLEQRLAVALSHPEDVVERLRQVAAGEPDVGRVARGVAVSQSGQLAFVYSGNGAQWPGMGRLAFARNAEFRRHLREVDALFKPVGGWSLVEAMHDSALRERLGHTSVAQPLIFAVQVSLTRALADHGIVPDLVLGHSVGEVAAAQVCGALTLKEAVHLIHRRSLRQEQVAGLGQMLAISLGAADARALLTESRLRDVEIAAINSPGSVTLSGSNEGIAAVTEVARRRRIATITLGIAYPFHSRMLESAREGILQDLARLAPARETIPFVSSVLGRGTRGRTLGGVYWWRNIRRPVLFAEAVRSASKLGANLFVEIAAKPILVSATAENLRSIDAVGEVIGTLSDRDDPDGGDPVLAAASRILVRDARGDRRKLCGSRPAQRVPLPTYPWQRQRLTIPATGERFEPFGGGFGNPPMHPLIGRRITAGEWRGLLDAETVPYLADHRVDGEVVVPAAALVEMALAVGRQVLGEEPLALADFDVLRPLTLAGEGMRELSTRYDTTTAAIEIWSRRRLTDGEWTLQARGRLSRPATAPHTDAVVRPDPARRRTFDGAAVYRAALLAGLDYGASFRRIISLQTDGQNSEMELSRPEAPLAAFEDLHLLHPVSLDAALHSLFVEQVHVAGERLAHLPIRFHRLELWQPGAIVTRACVRRVRETATTKSIDIRLLDAAGEPVADVTGAILRAVVLSQSSDEQRRFRIAFEPLQPPTPRQSVSPSGMLHTAQPLAGMDAWLLVRAFVRSLVFETMAAIMGGKTWTIAELARAGRINQAAEARVADLLEFLAGQQFAEFDEARCRLRRRPAPPATQALFRTLVERFPEAGAEIRLCSHALATFKSDLEAGGATAIPPAILEAFEEEGVLLHAVTACLSERIGQAHAAATPGKVHVALLHPWTAGALRLLQRQVVAGRIRASLVGGTQAEFDAIVARLGEGHFGFVDLADEEHGGALRFDLVLAVGIGPVMDRVAASGLDRLADICAGASVCVAGLARDPALDMLLGGQPGWYDTFLDRQFRVGRIPEADELKRLLRALHVREVTESADGNGILTLFSGTADPPASKGAAPALAIAAGALADGFGRLLLLAAQGRATLLAEGDPAGPDWNEALPAGVTAHLLVPVAFAADTSASTALATEILRLRALLERVRAAGRPVSLWVITRQARQPSGKAIEPAATGLSAFLRVAINEYPDIDIRLIDIPTFDTANAVEVLRVIEAGSLETEIVLGDSARQGLRVQRGAPEPIEAISAGRRVRLDMPQRGRLASMGWIAEDRSAPTEGEVEVAVAATGLNFRDIMLGLGVLDDDIIGAGLTGASLGFEFSGVVVRVGAGVHGLTAGDRVMGFASNAFASHVTVPNWSVSRVPDDVGTEAAATIPVAFATAWYGLVECARLRRRETVLIHGAAGGVGMAAVQIAQSLGATVLATAGTPDKAAMLRALGVADVYDSRSVSFADHIEREHGGVDVVLNSLAGEGMAASLRLLRPFGRFVELGKRDFLGNTTIGLRPFARNLSYFGVDLDQLLAHDRKAVARAMSGVLRQMRLGRLRPLPHRLFESDATAEAFRLMQGAGHIGKILVRPAASGRARHERAGFSPGDGVHLVVGGTQGLGFETAAWLVEKGAGTVVVASRSGVTDPGLLARMAGLSRESGRIVSERLDVRDEAAVAGFLAAIEARYGPLRGVIHAAMVLEDGLIQGLTEETLLRVLQPKVEGIRALDRAAASRSLDYFAAYSSAAAMIGSPGQGAYVAANAYIEGVMRQRRSRGLPGVALAWGAISDAGVLANDKALSQRLQRATGVAGVSSQDALAFLDEVLAAGDTAEPVQVYADIRRSAVASKLAILRTAAFAGLFAAEGSEEAVEATDLASTLDGRSEAEAITVLIPLLASEIGKILRLPIEAIDPRRSLTDLGMDSLMALELRLSVEKRFGVELPLLGIGDGSTLVDLVKVLAGSLRPDRGVAGDTAAPVALSGAEEAIIARHGLDMEDEEFREVLSAVERKRKAAG